MSTNPMRDQIEALIDGRAIIDADELRDILDPQAPQADAGMKTDIVERLWELEDYEQCTEAKIERLQKALRECRDALRAFGITGDAEPRTSARAALSPEAETPSQSITVAEALRVLLTIVRIARNDDLVDSSTQAGGWLCGDMMSEAVEAADAALLGLKGG